MLAANMSSPFNAAYVKAIRTDSLDTTPANVDPSGSGVLCPSRTHHAFLVKSILTSHTRWPVTRCHPCSTFCPCSSISNATPTLNISLASAFIQRSLPSFMLSSFACSTLVGILIPYLCLAWRTLVLSANMMASLFRNVCGTHQANAGSSSIPLDAANSAVSIGYDSFISASLIHDSDWSFHLTRNHQPCVVLRSLHRLCLL